MANYFVTRHPGAIEWAAMKGLEAVQITHLDIAIINSGDVIMGTLPINIAAQIIEIGARYLHLELDLPEENRGRDLSPDEMEQFGARLQEYHIVKIERGIDEYKF